MSPIITTTTVLPVTILYAGALTTTITTVIVLTSEDYCEVSKDIYESQQQTLCLNS